MYDTAQASISDEEEGAVLYLVSDNRVLSLTKLKTLEYRLFRKMREKLRNNSDKSQRQDYTTLLKKFIKEAKDLCGPYELPRNFKFYTDVFEAAYNQMDKYKDLLLERYVDFMEKVILDKNFSFKSHMF